MTVYSSVSIEDLSLSSRISFMADFTVISDSNSGSSSICNFNSNSNVEILSSDFTPPDVAALRLLSENLVSIFNKPDNDIYSDARIVIDDGSEIPVHRCILSARSAFFKQIFSNPEILKEDGRIDVKTLIRNFDVGYHSLVSVLGYLYSGIVSPLPKEVSVCADETCSHVACRPVLDFMVEVLGASFTFGISEMVSLYQRRLLDILKEADVDDIVMVLAAANKCAKACINLVEKCIDIVVRSNINCVTLEKALPSDLVMKILDSRLSSGLSNSEENFFPNKHVRRIHKALDSDDIELVGMLLKEGSTNLDNAYGLHYAIAYCDPKTVVEVLNLGSADINHKNSRGFTVLHVAAMRKEPKIIVSLLINGAQPLETTPDGRKAIQIAKRLTKLMDYETLPEEGKPSHKDRLCIEVLEQAERTDPIPGEAAHFLSVDSETVRMKLLYLESRVGLAKIFFPMEAKVAMEIAKVDGTVEFPVSLETFAKPLPSNNQRNTMDLNEAAFTIKPEHLARLRALDRTVKLGKRFFPRCSRILEDIVDCNDMNDIHQDGNQMKKKQRFLEIQEDVRKAFTEDMSNRSTISSSLKVHRKG